MCIIKAFSLLLPLLNEFLQLVNLVFEIFIPFELVLYFLDVLLELDLTVVSLLKLPSKAV